MTEMLSLSGFGPIEGPSTNVGLITTSWRREVGGVGKAAGGVSGVH